MNDDLETARIMPIEMFKNEYVEVMDKYLPISLKNRARGGESLHVVSMGCGFGLELFWVSQVLPGAQIEALDQNTLSLEGAAKFNKNTPSVTFRNTDLSQELIKTNFFDLAILRNPQINDGLGRINPLWVNIVKNSIQGLKPGGYLFLTSQDEGELESLLKGTPIKDMTPLESKPVSLSLVALVAHKDQLLTVLQK